MSKAIILQQVPFEGPGRLGTAFRDYGIPVEIRKLHAGDEVPTDLDEIRVLVVLGGPMGVADIGSSQFPFLQAEYATIQRMVAADRPVLGICLGAQLIAHAAGAKVYPNAKPGAKPEDPATPMPEFGWKPIKFPFPGGTDPLVMGMTDGAPMFHWHFDTFDLPKFPAPAATQPGPPPPTGNVLLASSAACRNQAFRFKNKLVGFQFHFEFTEADIEQVLANATPDVINAAGPGGIDAIREATAANYPRFARLGDKLIDNYIQFLKMY